MNVDEIILECLDEEHCDEPLVARLLGAIMEYWANQKDNELKQELLGNISTEYSSCIKKLIEVNQYKNRFLRTVAHDVTGPLSAIRGLSDLLLSEMAGPLTKEQKEYISTINVASTGILVLVNNLLDVSLIESGKFNLQVAKGSLEAVIRQRVRVSKLSAEEKGIVIQENYTPMPLQYFDPTKMAQVIDNLLSNAIKYSPYDSRIHVLLDRDGKMSRVSVRDEGPGIGREDQERIFREFYRLKNRPTGGEKSTGLGLAIARKVVVSHGGTLTIQSGTGEGSTFSFTLPLEDDHG